MGASVRQAINDVHPQMLRASSEGPRSQGETDPQEMGKRLIGLALDLAIVLSKRTKQELAFEMGYTDQGVIGRWISGKETPQFAKLWAVPWFRAPLVIALSQAIPNDSPARVAVTTTITIAQEQVA